MDKTKLTCVMCARLPGVREVQLTDALCGVHRAELERRYRQPVFQPRWYADDAPRVRTPEEEGADA